MSAKDTFPSLDALTYFNGFTPLYAEFSAYGFFGNPARLFNHVASSLPENADILDVGIGSGESAKPFISARHKVTGIDGSPEMIRHCMNTRLLPPGRLHLVDIARQHFPLPDNSFDLSFSNQTLYFLEDPGLALTEMARVTKPGGMILHNYRPAPGDTAIPHIHDVTGYNRTRVPATVRTWQHPPRLIEAFHEQAGLEPLHTPVRYQGYQTMEGSVDFALCLLRKPGP